jgi:hypothetical protein
MIPEIELEKIRERLKKASSCADWGKHAFELYTTKGDPTKLWYGDGDLCAEVHDNLGLGVSGENVAEFFAHAKEDIEMLLEGLDYYRRKNHV